MPNNLTPNPLYWTHPTKPYVVCFHHNRELRELDLEKLKSICRAYAHKMGKPQVADDFADAAVEISLRKIKNGFTEYGHLNKALWLWTEFDDKETGSKNHNGKKALAYKSTVSHSKPVNDDGDTYLDFFPDAQSLNAEQRLLLMETIKERLLLIKAENDERKKLVPFKNYHPSTVAVENRIYDFLLEKSENRGFGPLNFKTFAQECGMEPKQFRLVVGQLRTKARMVTLNSFFFLPDDFYFIKNAA